MWSIFKTPTDHTLYGGVSSQRRSRFERATRSLATFVHSHTPHSAHSLRNALLRYARFLNMYSRCCHVPREQTRFWRSLETRPYSSTFWWKHWLHRWNSVLVLDLGHHRSYLRICIDFGESGNNADVSH